MATTSIRDEAIEKVLVLEGKGGCIDPVDKGGLTCWGISQIANPDVDVKNLTKEAAKVIYIERYWDKFQLHKMAVDYPMATMKLFDMVVNMGGFTAIKIMQRAVGAKADGIIGEETLRALRPFTDEELLAMLKTYGSTFYKLIVVKDPSQQRFLKGWLRRAQA